MSLSINGTICSGIHFVGILGSGMSAIAQYLRWQGLDISGSDRLLDSPDTARIRAGLESIGCRLTGQDGSGITATTGVVCVSTAIEDDNPDIASARKQGKPVVHRSDVLAAIVTSRTTVAIAGTSGKSTVTAMIFEFLTSCDQSPSLISGASLRRLEQQGLIGNAFAGKSDLLVIEADESDGSLIKYHPARTVLLNVSKDHKSIQEVTELFIRLAQQSGQSLVNADDPLLANVAATVRFGSPGSAANWVPDGISLHCDSVEIVRNGTTFHLPVPGAHNASNLLAALCACELSGCSDDCLAKAVRTYAGVDRRFTVMRTRESVTVIDDFAHNPEKIRAAVTTAQAFAARLHVIYQPHGFGPTRFLKNEYVSVFRSVLRKEDRLYLLPIYYAGGSAQKDISSQDLIDMLGQVPFVAGAPDERDEVLASVQADAQQGDCILLMGARDPSLSAFAKKLADLFGGQVQETTGWYPLNFF